MPRKPKIIKNGVENLHFNNGNSNLKLSCILFVSFSLRPIFCPSLEKRTRNSCPKSPNKLLGNGATTIPIVFNLKNFPSVRLEWLFGVCRPFSLPLPHAV